MLAIVFLEKALCSGAGCIEPRIWVFAYSCQTDAAASVKR
jgi:hypothetical protein